MRLKHIKLAGFKSFVDPTVFRLEKNLVGIVGPNGCGKSNLIDAVRWVMGEGSAKTLRGGSMADVIFNGSQDRKPVGQASIELSFDNSDGSLGGAYGAYAQIDIRRQVNRDGHSSYFLNGTRCRRRDIVDVFLGTGLGPRSYSIIEQGTISKFVEAKPQELRLFLEEAAGITKYKERRRETETRIRHTRENLERLTDLREELQRQLNHLQRQAKAAERYKVLKTEETIKKAQYLALQWQQLQAQYQTIEQSIAEQNNVLEAAIADLRKIDARSEEYREKLHDSNEYFNEVQSRFYQLGADIARVEQDQHHRKQRSEQLRTDQATLETDQASVAKQLQHTTTEQSQLTQDLAIVGPQCQAAEEQAAQTAKALDISQQAMRDWQGQWDQFNEQASSAVKRAEVEQTQIQHLEQRIEVAQKRMATLREELARIEPARTQETLTELNSQRSTQGDQVAQLDSDLQNLTEQLSNARECVEALLDQRAGHRSVLQKCQGTQASLQALQEVALGQDHDHSSDWLEAQNLLDRPRLAQALTVSEGWEETVELVLANYLQGVCVDDLDSHMSAFADFKQGELMLLSKGSKVVDSDHQDWTLLTSYLSGDFAQSSCFAAIYVAQDLVEAKSMRSQLNTGESIVTQDGIWCGPDWVRVNRQVNAQDSVIKRERELQGLAETIAERELQVADVQAQLDQQKSSIHELEQKQQAARQALKTQQQQLQQLETQIGIKENHLKQMQRNRERLQTDIQDLTQQKSQSEQLLLTAREAWQAALTQMEGHDALRRQLLAMRDDSRQSLEAAKERAQADREQAHQLALRAQTLQTRASALADNLTQLQSQLDSFAQRSQDLSYNLRQVEAPLAELEQSLQQSLAQRVQVDEELKQARSKLDHIENLMRETVEARSEAEEQVQTQRSKLEQQRLDSQTLLVKRNTLVEQLAQSDQSPEAVLEVIPAEANLTAWHEQLENLERRIGRLGAINLAAIDEYDVQSERKQHLDTQNEDLEKALATLEAAIKKIDKESRQRLQETYDRVNKEFQTIFPKVFGGGRAYLELTGEELLDAGVTVMAQPPGKKNSSIHLLSGGEKALTAISLVFALFQLNPAPFCMLDEVDAPLDDHNVVRFCDLVRAMSDKTQFIVITHNKITMEMTDQLSGVTMSEPGVSRLVMVDIDEAVSLAAA